jgi:hypothetical protein
MYSILIKYIFIEIQLNLRLIFLMINDIYVKIIKLNT